MSTTRTELRAGKVWHVFDPPVRLAHGGKVYIVTKVDPPLVLVVRYSRLPSGDRPPRKEAIRSELRKKKRPSR